MPLWSWSKIQANLGGSCIQQQADATKHGSINASRSTFREEVTLLESMFQVDHESHLPGHFPADRELGERSPCSGKFMALLVHAARKGHLFHIQTEPRSRMRFQYIRLLLTGDAMDESHCLREVLRLKTPASMEGPNLAELVSRTMMEIPRRDPGLLLALVERQLLVDESALEDDGRSSLIRDAIGSTFNLFFNWITVLIAGDKFAKRHRMGKQSVLQELVIDYDRFLVDRVLPLISKWNLLLRSRSEEMGVVNVDEEFIKDPVQDLVTPEGQSVDGIDRFAVNDHVRMEDDLELTTMADILKTLRQLINKSMADILTRYEAELRGFQGKCGERSMDMLHALWYMQRHSTIEEWGQGVWTFDVEAPIATLRRKGSQINSVGQEMSKPFSVLKLLSRERVELEGQLMASVVSTPFFLEVTMNIGNIMCRVANASWDGDYVGHFPSALSIFVTSKEPASLFSVNKSSNNQTFKINLNEQLAFAVGLGVSNTVQGVIGAGAVTGAYMAVSSRPWDFEQLEDRENGGSFNWTLRSWQGKPFDRLNPKLAEKKASLVRFGRRPPSNPLLRLPFASDGSVLFSQDEYSEGLKWRFLKEREGATVGWVLEGRVDTTMLTKKGYWETRTLYFEHFLEHALIPDPEEPDKDKKKKKGKKAK